MSIDEASIAERMSYLPGQQRCRHRGRRIGACARQPSMDVFLSYPLGCICEVVHDAMVVALCVASHARASALHTTQSWIELGRFQVIAINHVRQVIAINHAHAEVMQPDVLLSAFSDLPGSCVQERWRRSALLAQGPPRLVVLLCERVGAAERVGGGVVAFAVRGPR
jgi:hypothetical protein